MKTKLFTATVFALGLAAGAAGISFLSPAVAQDSGQMDHSKMGHDMMGQMMGGMMNMDMKGDQGESSKAYFAANMKMHDAMNIEFSGNADVDFAKGMIPHHQGAIDMAKIVLQYGKDPEIRKLAEGVIAAQEGEIAFMTEWLKKNGQ